MTFDDFAVQLAMTLKVQPRGTAADLTDWAAAYWDGCQVVGVARRHDGSGRLDEELDLDEHWLSQHNSEIATWLEKPRYSAPAELVEWLKDAPPCDGW